MSEPVGEIVIARFRSTFEGERGVLTAELAPPPTSRWRSLCEANLGRFSVGLRGVPRLVADVIVVSTTPSELVVAELALQTVVLITNQVDRERP